jgi:hypothetical protein
MAREANLVVVVVVRGKVWSDVDEIESLFCPK